MSRRAFSVALLLALVLARPARAQEVESVDLARARSFFTVGSDAYARGRYLDAVEAFRQSYRFSGRVGLLYSIAQAYRRQYYLDQKRETLQLAIDHYRRYLEAGDGQRRAEASAALAELSPVAARLQDTSQEAGPEEPRRPAASAEAQVMITTAVEEARLSIDGKDVGHLPYISVVKPGPLRIRVASEGYLPYDRVIELLPGSVFPLDVELKEKPASVVVDAPRGSRVSIDGRFVASAPAAPFEVTPGKHVVTVTLNGRHAYSQNLELGRGRRETVRPELGVTGQRYVAWALMGAGGAGLLTSAVLGGLAAKHDAEAARIAEDMDNGSVSAAELDRYLHARDDRNDLRLQAYVTAGASLAAGTAGLLLYLFDEPRVELPERREGPPERERRRRAPNTEVSLAPLVGPGALGGALGARF